MKLKYQVSFFYNYSMVITKLVLKQVLILYHYSSSTLSYLSFFPRSRCPLYRAAVLSI